MKGNIAANLAGRVCTLLLSVLLTPVYLHLLGIESYGLIGFFLILQSVFGLLDLGLGATLNREFARLSVQANPRAEQRDLLRTFELLYWSAAAGIALVMIFIAPWIATRWFNAHSIDPAVLNRALRFMGFAIALQFPTALYQAGLAGLQRQTLMNVVLIVTSTVRSVGAAAVLWWTTRTVDVFFGWQMGAGAVQTSAFAVCTWRALGGLWPTSAHFRAAALQRVWRYATVVSANALIGLGLTQLDKLVLSKLLPLSLFGYYTLAATVAALPWALIIPVNTALFPRFTQLLERNDQELLADVYHRGCQILAAVLLPTAVVLAFFSREIVWVWTGSAETAAQTSILIALLVTGTALNGLASVPVYLQWAAGWPQLTMYTNCVAAAVLVPSMWIMAVRFGAVGAASVWVVLNLGYVVFTVPYMHTRLLKTERRRWIVEDVTIPLVTTLAAGLLLSTLMPAVNGRLATASLIIAAWCALFATCVLSASRIRLWLINRYGKVFLAQRFGAGRSRA